MTFQEEFLNKIKFPTEIVPDGYIYSNRKITESFFPIIFYAKKIELLFSCRTELHENKMKYFSMITDLSHFNHSRCRLSALNLILTFMNIHW